MRSIAFTLLANLFILTSLSQAQATPAQFGALQFDVPQDWLTAGYADSFKVTNPDGSLTVTLALSTEEDLEKTLATVNERVSKVLTDIQVLQQSKEAQHNGMKTFETTGSGKLYGEEVLWSLTVIQLPKPVLVLTFAVPEILQRDGAAIGAFFESIRPAQ